METSTQNSAFLKERVINVAPSNLKKLKQALIDGDEATFFKTTIQDSNNFHAVCRDTYPSISYLNRQSEVAMEVVHRLNEKKGKEIIAYSFDAGPNAYLFMFKESEEEVLEAIRIVFNKADSNETEWDNLKEEGWTYKDIIDFKVKK